MGINRLILKSMTIEPTEFFLSRSSLALGESFMDKWWDCEDLAGLFNVILQNQLVIKDSLLENHSLLLRSLFFNLQSRSRARQVAVEHYDLGDDLYTAMLDSRMVYTAAVWDGVETLDAAQEQKLELLCRKLGLQKGDRVLDIGCGWGSFMKYAVEKYGVTCVGITVSEGQTALGRKICAGLPIEFIIKDYREYSDLHGFDHIVSVEMIEAVGVKNFRTYFKKVHELLKPKGRFVLQAIGNQKQVSVADPWIDKYIFRNGILPSLNQLEDSMRDLFIFEHLENIGPDYDRTLMAWWYNFHSSYGKLSENNKTYNERFYRMWKYYLQACAALFRSRTTQDWQIVFTKK